MSLQQIGTADYVNVSRTLIPGASRLNKVGFNAGVGTSDTTIWNEATTLVVYPATVAAITVSSSSANDASAGTGARTVLLSGLDATFNPISETITLNGQTAVTSTLSYYRILNLTVLTAGSGGANAGVIYAGTGTVTAGVPATIYNSAGVGFNRSESAFTTIPIGMTGYLVQFNYTSNQSVGTAGTANAVTVKVMTRPATGNGAGLFGTSRILVGTQGMLLASLPTALTAGTDIELRAKTAATTAIVSGDFELLLCTGI